MDDIDIVEEPILKKKVKKNNNQPKELYQESEQPKPKGKKNLSSYEKFLQIFKKKDETISKMSDNKTNNIIKLSPNEIQLQKKEKLNFVQKKDHNSFSKHYDLDHLEFSHKLLQKEDERDINQAEEKNIVSKPNEGKRNLLSNFEILNENKKVGDDMINNNIKFRECAIKKELKSARVEKATNNYDSLILDSNSNEYIAYDGIATNIRLDSKISELIGKEEFDSSDLDLLNILNEYIDLIYFGYVENEFLKFRKIWLIHLLNHQLNSMKMQKQAIEEEAKKLKGYTKCRVLILTPYKRDAFEIIMDLIEYYNKGSAKKTSNKKRFTEEYGTEESQMQDNFKIGIAFAGKSINLYTPFTTSDIIVASPLGIRLVTGAKGDLERDFSFLSSIEILIIDQANVLYMQNWQHVEEILEVTNNIPKHKDMTNGLDEIRDYYLDNMSKFYRQNIVFSEFNFPELNALRFRFFENYKGCVQNKLRFAPILNENLNNFSVEFLKLDINRFEEDLERRFEFFKNKVWLKINDSTEMFKTVIFVNSYHEFVKLRNYFKKTNSFVQFISEYTDKKKIQSRLSKFNKKTIPFLLFSERAFFFNKCSIKNIHHIVYYSLPKNSEIYKSMIVNLQDPEEEAQFSGPSFKNKVRCIFSKYDAMFLEKIVGNDIMAEFLAEYNKASTFII